MNMKMKKSLAGLAFGLAFAAGAVSASAATGVLKSPYLIYPNVPSQMQVLWQDNNTQTDAISLYSDSGYQNQVCQDTSTEYNATTNLAYGHQHTYTFGLTGACSVPLATNTMYYYTVNDGTNTYKGSFMTAPKPIRYARKVSCARRLEKRSFPVGRLDAAYDSVLSTARQR